MVRMFVALASGALMLLPQSGGESKPLDSLLRSQVEQGAVPGVVAMVVNGRATVYAGAFGTADVANRQPMRLDAIFRLASMTKPITSLAAMMLVEAKQIALDDPVARYLPEFSAVRVLAASPDADGHYTTHPPRRALTIRDLLTHTSGIAYAFVDSRLTRLDDGRKGPAELPLVSEPGERFVYGPNTAVLGDVIAKVSGMPLDRFLSARIFEPLGMRDTFFTVPADSRDRVVTLHVRTSSGILRESPNPRRLASPVRGDGGLFSTAADYARFMQLFLNGGRAGGRRLVAEQTIAAMTTDQIAPLTVTTQNSADPTIARPFPSGAGKDGFGFGFQIAAAPPDPGGRSPGSLSWGGIFNTHFWIDPHRRIAAVVLMQLAPYYDPAAINLLRGVEREVYREASRPGSDVFIVLPSSVR